jgi:hypothetical protein
MRNEDKYVTLPMVYRGEWSPTASYNTNDVVRVFPSKSYSLPWDSEPTTTIDNGVPYLEGTIQGIQIMVAKFVPVPGTYVCTTPIPAFGYTISTLQAFGQDPSGYTGVMIGTALAFSSLDSFIQKNIRSFRFSDVNYFPVWPEYPDQAYINPSNLVSLKGRYWDLMSLLPSTMYVCENGATSVQYTDTQTIPSGSANYTGSI